ncbi:hypothetical protein [Mucilaginibacter antarcticus]|uniref:hypothetical protein n=1 Tax=Mucilaginibacter antarcticus TaxID=1855725 RepID=UPI00363D5256
MPQPEAKPKYLTQINRINGNNTTTTTYSYDDKKRLKEINIGASTTTFTYILDRITATETINKNGNAVVVKIFNQLNYVDNVLATKKTSVYDGAGQLVTEVSNGYAYDDKSKLTETHQEGNVVFYEHDADGNISKEKSSSSTYSYTYDGKASMFANLNSAVKK